MYRAGTVTNFKNGDVKEVKAAAYHDAGEAGKSLVATLYRVGDAAPYATKTLKASSNTQTDVSFDVKEAGQYYITVNGATTLNAPDAANQTVRISYADGQSVEEQASWFDDYSFDYNVDKVNGVYTVTGNDLFAVEKVTDPFGGEVDSTEYSVVYLYKSGTNAGKLVFAEDTVDGRVGGYPEAPSVADGATKYEIAVVKGDLTNVNLDAVYDVNGLRANWATKTQEFTIKPVTVSVEGATAYEYDALADDEGISDEEFTFNGVADRKIGVKVNGTALPQASYTATLKSAPSGAELNGTTPIDAAGCLDFAKAPAGDYVVTIVGKGAYSGQTDVKFTIDELDLSAASIVAADVDTGDNKDYTSSPKDHFKVDGGSLGGNIIVAECISFTDHEGNVRLNNSKDYTYASMSAKGSYVFKVSAYSGIDSAYAESISGEAFVTVNAYDNLASFAYDSTTVTPGATFKTFVTSLGQTFNPNNLTVDFDGANGDDPSRYGFSYKVYDEEGNEVADWSKAGTYKLVCTADTDGSFDKGGTTTAYFKVVDTHLVYDNVTAYAAIDGKMLSTTSGAPTKLAYKASAFELQTIVKETETKEPVDESLYTVTVKDSKGTEVESIQEVGEYSVEVKLSHETSLTATFYVEIVKATLVEGKATADFFAIPADGSAATPSFVASTESGDDFDKGLKLELTGENSSVVYWNELRTDKVSASDLDEAGSYWAEVKVLTTVESFEAGTLWIPFQLKTAAAFSDVDANAWYAGVVYDAAGFGYMTGLSGTKLFMPEAQITRAEVAQVFANMAGQVKDYDKHPTQFSDVDAEAWYAQAIDWASQAGIVGGYEGTDVFGTFDNATREQIATMIYRYAKAQGMDVTVEDEAAALAKYADGASVSEYAKTAMAYCIEQGVFGVDVDTLRPADYMSRAEMAATSVRVQPEGPKQDL